LFLILIIAGIAFSCGSNSGKSDSDDSSEQVTAEESQGAEAEDTADTDSEDADAQNAETQDDGASAEVDQTYIDPDFKAFMDSYEEFMNEYIDFMVKYSNEGTSDMEMLADYTSLAAKATEYESKVNSYDTQRNDNGRARILQRSHGQGFKQNGPGRNVGTVDARPHSEQPMANYIAGINKIV